jgi:hypothetical protein
VVTLSAWGSDIPRDGTLFGYLFESLVTQSVRVYAQAGEAEVRHLRTMVSQSFQQRSSGFEQRILFLVGAIECSILPPSLRPLLGMEVPAGGGYLVTREGA